MIKINIQRVLIIILGFIYLTGNLCCSDISGKYNWSNETVTAEVLSLHPVDTLITKITKANNVFFALGNARYYTSEDTETWIQRDYPLTGYEFNDIIFYNGLYLAAYRSGTTVYICSSPDLVVWTTRWSRSSQIFGNFVKFNNLVIAALWDGLALSTPDGITWTVRRSEVDSTYHSAIRVRNNKSFLSISGGGTAISDNGTTWTNFSGVSTYTLPEVDGSCIFHKDKYYFINYSYLVTYDGSTFQSLKIFNGLPNSPHSWFLAQEGDNFTAIGCESNYGMCIVRSTDAGETWGTMTTSLFRRSVTMVSGSNTAQLSSYYDFSNYIGKPVYNATYLDVDTILVSQDGTSLTFSKNAKMSGTVNLIFNSTNLIHGNYNDVSVFENTVFLPQYKYILTSAMTDIGGYNDGYIYGTNDFKNFTLLYQSYGIEFYARYETGNCILLGGNSFLGKLIPVRTE